MSFIHAFVHGRSVWISTFQPTHLHLNGSGSHKPLNIFSLHEWGGVTVAVLFALLLLQEQHLVCYYVFLAYHILSFKLLLAWGEKKASAANQMSSAGCLTTKLFGSGLKIYHPITHCWMVTRIAHRLFRCNSCSDKYPCDLAIYRQILNPCEYSLGDGELWEPHRTHSGQ